jgi:hypothetical protein
VRNHGQGIGSWRALTDGCTSAHLREGEAATVRKPAPKRVEKLDPFKAYIVDRVNAAARIGSRPSFCLARSRATTAARRG